MSRAHNAVDAVLGSLQRIVATAAVELRLNVLTFAPWVIGLVLAALGYLTVRMSPDQSSFPLSWAISHEIGGLAAVLLLFLAASLAYRPSRYEVNEILDSKPVASEELLLGRWLGMAAALLVPLGLLFATVMIGQKVHAKPPVSPFAFLLALQRMAPPILFLATLSFCLVTLTRVLVLGAGLSGLIWFSLQLGQRFYPTVFRMELTQNAPVYLGLTLTMILVMLLTCQGRRRRKQDPRTYALVSLTVLAFLATTIGAAWSTMAMPGRDSTVATWRRIGERRVEGGQLPPNFAWHQLDGRRVSLASLRGKHVMLVLFQPKDGGLLPLLKRLGDLRREFQPKGIDVLALCLSEDLNAGRYAARLARSNVPIAAEWGGPAQGDNFDPRQPPSVLAWTFRVNATPLAIVLGPDGHEVQRNLPLDEPNYPSLKLRLQGILAGEAAPEEAPAIPGVGSILPGGTL